MLFARVQTLFQFTEYANAKLFFFFGLGWWGGGCLWATVLPKTYQLIKFEDAEGKVIVLSSEPK